MKEAAEPNHRKLIRPSLSDVKEQLSQQSKPQNQQRGKRHLPPEHTNAESFYYVKQMQNHTPMVLVLNDGEELRGTIEWYDRNCLKIHREEGPNLLVYKGSIKYLYKAADSASDQRATGPNGSAGNGSAQ